MNPNESNLGLHVKTGEKFTLSGGKQSFCFGLLHAICWQVENATNLADCFHGRPVDVLLSDVRTISLTFNSLVYEQAWYDSETPSLVLFVGALSL